MKTRSYFLAVVSILLAQQSFCQASFQIPITLRNGTHGYIHRLGVNPGNTIGVDTSMTLGRFREAPPPVGGEPPYDWDSRFVTIPGRVNTFPIGLGGGVIHDYRGYVSSTQIDSFKIVISGDATDTAATTVSWPSDLANYGVTWTIKPQTGSDWPVTNMLTSTSVVIGPGKHKNIIIIKIGAMGTNEVQLYNGNLPSTYILAQNYPNPFNPSTEIRFSIPEGNDISLKVYNLLGQEVATLVNEFKTAGDYRLSFDASGLSSGMYFYRLQSAGHSVARMMSLVK